MIVGKMVKVRFKKYFVEQRLWVFVGKVLHFSENWLMVEGKGIISYKGIEPAHVDEEPRTLLIPRENIAHIRLLPDSFSVRDVRIHTKGFRQYIQVEDEPDTSIGEL